jgi:serine protease AprX
MAAMFLCGNASAVQYAYLVKFTNKDNTVYSLSSPLAYLSSRSVDRRIVQHIAIDSTDLPVPAAYLDSVLTLTGSKLHGTSKWFNFCVLLTPDTAAIHNLDGKPYIGSVKRIAFYTDSLHKPGPTTTIAAANKTTAGDGTYYGNTWTQTQLVSGSYLHDAGYTGNGKLIAVLDAGFIDADTHVALNSLWSSGRVLDQHNFVLANDFIFGYDTHGAKALSTMAGYLPGTYVGSAPMSSFALYITEDGNSEQPIELVNMLMASERADSIGADVITTSLGYNTFDNVTDNFVFATDFDGKSTVAAAAANMAVTKGILFVASAGNEGGGGWNMVLTPGDADSALTIGSVDAGGISAANSGYGPNAAGQVKPDVCGMGQSAALLIGSSGYVNQNGTSYATPQIAGWAACLWQAYPTATPFQIRQAIIRCASSYLSPGVQLGYGIPDFSCAKSLMLSIPEPPAPFSPARWVTAAPNPFVKDITLVLGPDTEQSVTFILTDVAGKQILEVSGAFNKGFNTPYDIELPNLPSGIYILKAVSPTKQQVLKLVKQ